MIRPTTSLLLLLLAASTGTAADAPTPVPAPAPKTATPASSDQQLLATLGTAGGTQVTTSSSEVLLTRHDDQPGHPLELAISPAADGWPGVSLRPAGGTWDFSRSGRVEARITNPMNQELLVNLRIDNGDDGAGNQWNCECARIEPCGSGTVAVRFGHSYGKPGFALDPAKVPRVMVFIAKPKAALSFTIDGVTVTGAPGETLPTAQRTRLRDGVIVGPGCTIDGARTAAALKGAQVTTVTVDGRPALRLAASGADAALRVQPARGRWDLGDHQQVTVRVRNAGTVPTIPRVRLDSAEGASPWVAGEPLAPGASGSVVVPFFSSALWTGVAGSGTQFASDVTTGVSIQAAAATGQAAEVERVLEVVAVVAGLPPAKPLPEWLGSRPPVPGTWTRTLDDDFTGTAVDPAHWSIYGENHWDKVSHFSKDNLIVADGMAKLRYSKTRGHHNDDPKRKESDDATGFLTSLGRWSQRYGYFEARMKLPTAPGLWPAFWMMPDRGADKGLTNGQRQTTRNGGMEFDIMEYLTRYGSGRYNIALHWDDYGKDHRSVGNGRMYVRPDAQGWIVSGMLWEPGRVAFYGNGELLGAWADERVGNVPGFIMFTMPSGGWGGNELDGSGLPDDFAIDWVRVWQRDDLAALPPTPITVPAPAVPAPTAPTPAK